MADIFNRLMTDTLGYSGYLAQGGDWGAFILARLRPRAGVPGVNILTMRHGAGPQTDAERAWQTKFTHDQIAAGRLSHPAGDQTLDAQLR